MSDENLWGDEEPFNDMPDEAQLDENGQPKQAPPVRLNRPLPPPTPAPVEQVVEEEYEAQDEEQEAVDQAEEDFAEVLTDASLRLEQGTLYKLIMNSNLFEGVDADPKAIQNVQREVRKFAKERMEIMLGMRKETATVEHLDIDFPLNALEIDILKKLASAATKGASEHADRYVPEVTRTTEEVPIVNRKMSLNPIRGNSPRKPAPTPAPSNGRRVNDTQKPLKSKPSAPVKRTKFDLTIDQIAAEEGIPRELLEEHVPGMGGGKKLHELTETELLERNNIAAKRRGKQVRSPNSLPMATPEQQEMLAIQRATQVAGGTPLMAQILDAVKKMPVNNKN